MPVANPRSPQMTYHVDTSFTADERQCIEYSTKQWRDQTIGLADIQLAYDYEPGKLGNVLEHALNDKIVRWTSTTPEVVVYEREMSTPKKPWILLGQTAHKITDPIRLPITVSLVMDRLQDAHECHLTTIHELGHGFGLPHIGHQSDIMFPSVDLRRSDCLKNDDLVMFSMVNQLPGGLMKPCADDPVLVAADNAPEEDTDVTEAE